jgi:hypothetical protein
MTMLQKLTVVTAVAACLVVPASAFARGGGHGGHGGGGWKGASFHGGGWKGGGHRGHFWRGRWWGYGVGYCSGPRPATCGSAATERCSQMSRWRTTSQHLAHPRNFRLREAALGRPLRVL